MNDIKLTSFKTFFESYKLSLNEAPLMRTGNSYNDMLKAFTTDSIDGKEAKDMLANVDDSTMLKWMKSKFIKRNLPIISREKMAMLLDELKLKSDVSRENGKDEYSRTSY